MNLTSLKFVYNRRLQELRDGSQAKNDFFLAFVFSNVAKWQVNVETLLPRMQGICEFMLAAQQDPDSEVGFRHGS